MRLLTISLLALFSILTINSDLLAQSKQYVAVSESFVNVYKDLDPTSIVIGQAKKGDHLELVAVGDSWYKVKLRDSEGWLEKRAGDVVNDDGKTSPIAIIIILLIIAGAFGAVAWYIYKSKLSSST